jgi:hypothetical protein
VDRHLTVSVVNTLLRFPVVVRLQCSGLLLAEQGSHRVVNCHYLPAYLHGVTSEGPSEPQMSARYPWFMCVNDIHPYCGFSWFSARPCDDMFRDVGCVMRIVRFLQLWGYLVRTVHFFTLRWITGRGEGSCDARWRWQARHMQASDLMWWRNGSTLNWKTRAGNGTLLRYDVCVGRPARSLDVCRRRSQSDL